jgi:FtsZ-binding cell division protein ZapB
VKVPNDNPEPKKETVHVEKLKPDNIKSTTSPLLSSQPQQQRRIPVVEYHEYFRLLGITEFRRVYLQIKDNPLVFVNHFKLCQNARIGEDEVIELLKIANGYLPRIRLEYDRCKEEKSSLQAELSSWKAELNNIARTYQQFVDRNVALKRREDELQLSINELEAKESELQRTISGLIQHQAEFQEDNICNDNLNLEIKQEAVIITNDIFIPPANMVIDYPPNENETLYYYSSQVEPSSRTLIFDTKDLFPAKAQT